MNCDECGENVPDNLRLCPDCAIPKHSKASRSFAPARGWTAPPAEQREMSERVARRDGHDWRCGHCVEAAQECLNGDRGCPYRQPKREQSNAELSHAPTRVAERNDEEKK